MYLYKLTENLALQGSGIVASSENYEFPAALILNRVACDVWRSKALAGTETLTIDLGGSYKAADFPNGLDLLVDSWNANSVCSAITYTLTGPGTTGALTLVGDADKPQKYHITLDATTGATALVITFTKNSSSDVVQVGKLFFGPANDTTSNGGPSNDGFTRTWKERTNRSFSTLGQRFSEKRASYWAGDISIPNATAANAATLGALFDEVGTHTPFWVIVGPTIGQADASEMGLPRYCYLTGEPKQAMVAYGAGFVWGLKMGVEKQL